jgi:hypothetical protein
MRPGIPLDFSKMFGDSFSIDSMEKVLGILQNVEAQPQQHHVQRTTFDSNFLNKFTHDFGKQLLRCRIINYVNNRPYILSNPKMVAKYPENFHALVDLIMSTVFDDSFSHPQSVFNQLKLNNTFDYYQSIARYYLMNEEHCIRRLNMDIRHSAKKIISYNNQTYYNLPTIAIPPACSYANHDPLIIQSALVRRLASNRKELYLLLYVLKDSDVLEKFVSDYQRKHGFPVVDVDSIIGLMSCQEMEGAMAFEVLCKRILLKSFEERTEKALSTEGALAPAMGTKVKREKKKYNRKFENLKYWEDILEQTNDEAESEPNMSNFSIVVEEPPHRMRSKQDIPHVLIKSNENENNPEAFHDGILRPKQIIDVKYSDINCALILEKFHESKSLMKIKAILAYKSNIPNRIIYSRDYQRALLEFEFDNQWYSIYYEEFSSRDNQVIKILCDHFDRFFGMFYSRSPLNAEKWLINLLFAYEANPDLFSDEVLRDAIFDYKEMLTSVEFKLRVKKVSPKLTSQGIEVSKTKEWFKLIRQITDA